MGHIELAAPVSHIWYFKGIPSRMGLILDLSPRTLEKVLYFANYIVLDPVSTGSCSTSRSSPRESTRKQGKTGASGFRVGMGAESIKELLEAIDHGEGIRRAEKRPEGVPPVRREQESSNVWRLWRPSASPATSPEWMVMTVIPVIPPDLRPMVQLDGGRFATSDLNDLYRTNYQQKQPSETTAGAWRSGYHRPQRETYASGGCRCPDR